MSAQAEQRLAGAPGLRRVRSASAWSWLIVALAPTLKRPGRTRTRRGRATTSSAPGTSATGVPSSAPPSAASRGTVSSPSTARFAPPVMRPAVTWIGSPSTATSNARPPIVPSAPRASRSLTFDSATRSRPNRGGERLECIVDAGDQREVAHLVCRAGKLQGRQDRRRIARCLVDEQVGNRADARIDDELTRIADGKLVGRYELAVDPPGPMFTDTAGLKAGSSNWGNWLSEAPHSSCPAASDCSCRRRCAGPCQVIGRDQPPGPYKGVPAACASAILVCSRMKSRSDLMYVTITRLPNRRCDDH